MKYLFTTILLFTTLIVSAQDFDFNPIGLEGEVLNYDQFTVHYNEKHEQPNWVTYYLTKLELELPGRDRITPFLIDVNVTTGSATHDEYTNSGYDRGHLSRAMFNKASADSYRQSYFMSNISPQIGVNFNRTGGDWYALEELEIKIAKGLGELYSVSGPIFEDNIEVIGDDVAITVPGYFFKAFLSPNKSETIGFILKHDTIDLPSIWDSAVTIDELEGLTGLNFWGKLDNKIEAQIENKLNLEYWKKVIEDER